MNKFTGLGAAVLFAFFITACDNATNKIQESVATQTDSDSQGVADFKKIIDWHQAQEKTLATVQAELQETVASGDKVKIDEGLKVFSAKISDVIKSLDALEIKHSAINEFKDKTKHTLVLSNDLIAESVKVMANRTPEAQKIIQDKSQALLQTGQELQQLQLQLQQKFAPAAK